MDHRARLRILRPHRLRAITSTLNWQSTISFLQAIFDRLLKASKWQLSAFKSRSENIKNFGWFLSNNCGQLTAGYNGSMTQEEQRPKAFKSSIWYVGMMVSGFCLIAGLAFNNRCVGWSVRPMPKSAPSHSSLSPPKNYSVVEIIEHPLSEREAAAQTCRCHPNKVPENVESTSSATLEIKSKETGETIVVPPEY